MDATALHAGRLPAIECASACICGLGKVSIYGMNRSVTGSTFNSGSFLPRTINSLVNRYPMVVDSTEFTFMKTWIKQYETEHNVSFPPNTKT